MIYENSLWAKHIVHRVSYSILQSKYGTTIALFFLCWGGVHYIMFLFQYRTHARHSAANTLTILRIVNIYMIGDNISFNMHSLGKIKS